MGRSAAELVAAMDGADQAQWVHLWRQLQERDDAGPQLAAVLRDASPELRRRALSTLTRARSPELVDVLAESLTDDRRPVRRLAVMRLGDTGAPTAVEPLLAILDPRQPPDLRSEAIRALQRLGGREATEAIARALADPDAGVREVAAEALYELADAATTPALEGALEDESRPVRDWAGRALQRISGGPPAAPEIALPGSWYSDPLMNAAAQIYCFREDGSGEVEDFNMGVTNDRAAFTYEVDGDVLEFHFGGGERPRTHYRLEAGQFRHPYKGELPCGVLLFSREPYFTRSGPQNDAVYYRLFDDQ